MYKKKRTNKLIVQKRTSKRSTRKNKKAMAAARAASAPTVMESLSGSMKSSAFAMATKTSSLMRS